MTHLDTSFLIRALLAGSPEDAALRRWLRRGDRLGISSVTWAEFLCGPREPNHDHFVRRVLGEPVAFTAEDAACAAEFFRRSGRRRGTLADCMIAAVAIREGAALATANPSDFVRLRDSGLVLMDLAA
jgi:predicted nucleic acid-binding protein